MKSNDAETISANIDQIVAHAFNMIFSILNYLLNTPLFQQLLTLSFVFLGFALMLRAFGFETISIKAMFLLPFFPFVLLAKIVLRFLGFKVPKPKEVDPLEEFEKWKPSQSS